MHTSYVFWIAENLYSQPLLSLFSSLPGLISGQTIFSKVRLSRCSFLIIFYMDKHLVMRCVHWDVCPPDPGAKKVQKGLWKLFIRRKRKRMTKERKKWKRQQFLIKNHYKIDGKFSRQKCLDPDPVCPAWEVGSGSDPTNIRPDPKPCPDPWSGS